MIRGLRCCRIHRRIGLDVGNPLPLTDCIQSTNRTDDAGGHGVVQPKRIADGNRPFPWLELVGVAQGCHRQLVGHHFDHRHVGEGVGAEHLAFEVAPVRKGHGHLIRPTHDVFVGEDQAAGPGYEAGSLALLPLAGGPHAEHPTKGVVHLFHHVNPHHGRSDAVHRLHDHVVPRL